MWRLRSKVTSRAALGFFALGTVVLSSASVAQLPDHVSIRRSPTPSWVQPVELEPLMGRRLSEGEPPRLVLHDTQILVPANDVTGSSQRFEQLLFRLDSSADVDEVSTLRLDFDPSYQELQVHAVRVLRGGEWTDRIARSRSSVTQVEDDLEGQIYDQSQTLLMILDDVRVGDWLSVEYTSVGANSVLGDDWADDVWLVSEAVSRRSVRVVTERDLAFALHGDAPEPVQDEMVNGRREIRWALEAQPDPDLWLSVPWGHSQQPWVQLSTYDGWSDIVRWALPVFEVPPASGAVREIAAGFTERRKERQLLQARDWVQRNIRYFSVSMGEHSHRPHLPDETLGRRYGDCKDKTVLLLALLRELGIESWPVLINAGWREGLATFLPSPFAFDHIIVAARLDDEVVWIDPTLTQQGGRALADITVPQYRYGLEVKSGVDGLSELPLSQRDTGLKTVAYVYRVEEDLLSYEVDVKTVFSGADAEVIRRDLDGTTDEELQEGYLEYYQAEHLTVSVREPLSLVDDRESNVVEINERYSVVSSGEDLFGYPFITFDLELGGELSLAGEDRTSPLALSYPRRREESIRIETPTVWGFSPVEDTISTPWFNYGVTSTIARDRRSIEINYVLEMMSDAVAVADLAEYDQKVNEMSESLGYGLGPVGFGESSMLGRQRSPLISAIAAGTVTALAVLAFLALGRVGDRRLLAYWLPSGRMGVASTEAPTYNGVRYGDPSTRLLLAVIALALASLADVVSIPVGFLPGSDSEWVFLLEFLYLGFAILLVLVAAFFVILAQRQLLRNLQALGLCELDPGLTWSTFSWFVPIAFLFVPYLSFRQVVVGSSSPADRRTIVALLRSWWGFWIFASVLSGAAAGVLLTGGVGVGQWLETMSSVFQFLAGVLLITLLLVLRSVQRDAARLAVVAQQRGVEVALSPEVLSEQLHEAPSPVPHPDPPTAPPPPPPPVG